jgi:AraC-like DNA-binding protein
MGRLNESRISAALTDTLAAGSSLGMDAGLHAQHYAAVFVGVDAHVIVREPDGAVVRGRAIMIAPGVRHSASCAGVAVGLLYDPEALPRVAVAARARGRVAALDGRFVEAAAAHRAALDRPDVLVGLARELAEPLAAGATNRAFDRRVARVVDALRHGETSVPKAGISPAHLQVLFVKDVGLPIRTYRLWHRLLVGMRSYPQIGATAAAHLAGFADLAHFSRTCRRMLGYSPTALRDSLLRG